MFQNYGLLSIIFSFLISFIDEIGEMGEISSKKVFLITGNEFPQYFESGEIATEINIDKLSSILDDPLFRGIN